MCSSDLKTIVVASRPASLIAPAILMAVVANVVCGCNRSAGPRDLLSLALVERGPAGQVVGLSIYNSDITDAELQQLADHNSSLRELSLQECKLVSNDALIGLQNATELRILRLTRVAIDDAGLAHLRTATSLNEVLLAHTEIDGAGDRKSGV